MSKRVQTERPPPVSRPCVSCVEELQRVREWSEEELYERAEQFYYVCCPNEAGWHCYTCGRCYGRSSTLDHCYYVLKIEAVRRALYKANLLSTPTLKEPILAQVEKHCLEADNYSQCFIAIQCLAADRLSAY